MASSNQLDRQTASGSLPERVVFFGTPEFAVPTLEALDRAGVRPIQVVSQPARPVGRGRKLVQPPVAQWAIDHSLPMEQPAKVRSKAFVASLRKLEPDVAVVVAFGQIFPQTLLDVPRLGCVNLHGSLLPRYRGAAPIQASILAGDQVTGVTTMLMEAGLDSGPMLLKREVPIGAHQTASELAGVLAQVGGELVVETLRGLNAGLLEPEPQDHSLATHFGRIAKSDGAVDWSQSAQRIYDQLRAFTPWPGITTQLSGEPLKVLWGVPIPSAGSASGTNPVLAPPVPNGTVVELSPDGLAVACGEESVFRIERCQRPGRKAVSATDFARGERVEVGSVFV